MYGLCTTKPANWSRLLRSLPIAVATISILLVATNAKAACGDPRAYKSTVVPKMPILAHLDSGATTEPGNPNDKSLRTPTSHPSGEMCAWACGQPGKNKTSA
jgi:hypothetical protein